MPAKTYITIQGQNGQPYLMKTDRLSDQKADLQSWKARVIWDLLHEQQPERFFKMISEQALVPFLNEICAPYYQRMEEHLQRGLNEAEATEIEWPLLLEKAGL